VGYTVQRVVENASSHRRRYAGKENLANDAFFLDEEYIAGSRPNINKVTEYDTVRCGLLNREVREKRGTFGFAAAPDDQRCFPASATENCCATMIHGDANIRQSSAEGGVVFTLYAVRTMMQIDRCDASTCKFMWIDVGFVHPYV